MKKIKLLPFMAPIAIVSIAPTIASCSTPTPDPGIIVAWDGVNFSEQGGTPSFSSTSTYSLQANRTYQASFVLDTGGATPQHEYENLNITVRNSDGQYFWPDDGFSLIIDGQPISLQKISDHVLRTSWSADYLGKQFVFTFKSNTNFADALFLITNM